MPLPYAVRVKTSEGYQDLVIIGPPGPEGPPGPPGSGGGFVGDADWIDATYLGAYGTTPAAIAAGEEECGYRKYGLDVYIRGYVDTGFVSGAPIFNLPDGYRPPAQIFLTVQSEIAGATMTVETNGDVIWHTGGQTYLRLREGANRWFIGFPVGGGGDGGGGGGHAIQDEVADLVARPKLAFVGDGVTATDDSANDRTVVTIPGGGGGEVFDTEWTVPTLNGTYGPEISYRRHGQQVYIKGFISEGWTTPPAVMFTLRPDCRPDAITPLTMTTDQGAPPTSEVHPNGDVVWTGGGWTWIRWPEQYFWLG